MDDRPLIDRLRAGDASAFAEIVRRHQRQVYGFLRARLLRHETAEATACEVFRRLAEAPDDPDASEPLLPRLIATANALAFERNGKRRRGDGGGRTWESLCRELKGDSPPGEAPGAVEAEASALDQALAGLEPSARKAIELHYSANLGEAGIGAHLKRSESAAAALLFRAREGLQRSVDAPIETPGAAP